jgi:hypothetical protein
MTRLNNHLAYSPSRITSEHPADRLRGATPRLGWYGTCPGRMGVRGMSVTLAYRAGDAFLQLAPRTKTLSNLIRPLQRLVSSL